MGIIVSGGLDILRSALCPRTGGLDLAAILCLGAGLALYRRWKRSPLLFLLSMGTVCGLLRLAVLELGWSWPVIFP